MGNRPTLTLYLYLCWVQSASDPARANLLHVTTAGADGGNDGDDDEDDDEDDDALEKSIADQMED